MGHSPIEPSAWLWARPDFQSLAFGRKGEVLAAKVRLGVMALAALIPLESVLLRPPDAEARIGLGAALSVFALGTLVLRLAQRPTPPAWLGLFTCLLDISTVSAINAGFVLAGQPLAATNSRVVFSCYFVALALVCLRQDRRWCLVAALAAIVQYAAIVLWAASRYDLRGPAFELSGYGTFNWDNQAGRLILLAAAGAIGTVIVVQSRGYWEAVIHYLDAFPLSVLITGPDGRSQYANRAAQQLLGRAVPAGADASELDAQSFLAGTDQPYPPARSAIARALAGESSASDDLEIQRPAARISVAAWGAPMLDAGGRVANAIAVFHDETQRRRAEEELRQTTAFLEASEERARALLETAPDAMVIVDRGGAIVLVNSQCEKLFGYRRAELIGQPVEMLVPAALREAHVRHRTAFAAASSTRPMGAGLELHARRKDGSIVPVEVSLSPLATEKGILVSGAIRDVTERRRLERMLRDANAELGLRSVILEAVAEAAERLFQAASWEEVATEVLGGIGGAVGVSRVSFFQVSALADGEPAARLRFGWVAPGIAPLAAEMRQEVPFRSAGFGRWLESLGRGETVHGPVRDFPDGERLRLAAQGVRSLAVVPVRLGGRFRGFLGFDDCQVEREWSQVEILALRVAADTLGAAIEGKERAAAVEASEERYRALFEQSLGLLCTHALDGRILTINGAAAAALGRSADQMVGHSLGEFLAPGVRGDLAAYLAAIAAAGEMSGTMILLDDGGGERVWQYRNHVLREPGQDPYVVGNAVDVTDRTRLERVLREQALTDPLTGLANRALFEDRLRREIERARRNAGLHGEMPLLALAYLDLDRFKDVNDRFGHAAGDALLREVGSRLREAVRTLDTVARLGGDEFALILPNVGSAANARRLIEKLLESLRRPILHDGTALTVSVSLGVSMLLRNGDSAEYLTARADEAMYAVKAAGRNGYRFFGDAGSAGDRGPGEGRGSAGVPPGDLGGERPIP